MAPPSGLQFSSKASDHNDKTERLPPLARSITAPTNFQQSAAAAAAASSSSTTSSPSLYHGRSDPSHLAPEDAFHAASPPRRSNAFEPSGSREHIPRHLYRKDGGSRSRSRRRRKRPWKKLLWVQQSCKSFIHALRKTLSLLVDYETAELMGSSVQIRTITPTRGPSSRTSSAIPG